MRVNKSIFFITVDMGINLVEPIEQEFPDRFLNVGIAEQNAIGVAAGLANLGFRPWVYSISNFLIHRCFEQIRNDVVLHDYPVTLLGTSAGFDNSTLGPTHHIIDDWGLIAQLPGASVYTPANDTYARQLPIRLVNRSEGLVYVRVGKGSFPDPSTEDCLVTKPITQRTRHIILTYGSFGSRFSEWFCQGSHDEFEQTAVVVLNKVHPLPEAILRVMELDTYEFTVIEDTRARIGLGYDVAAKLLLSKHEKSLSLVFPEQFSARGFLSFKGYETELFERAVVRRQ
jgi:transketolase